MLITYGRQAATAFLDQFDLDEYLNAYNVGIGDPVTAHRPITADHR